MQKLLPVLLFYFLSSVEPLQAQQSGDFIANYLMQNKPEKLHLHFDKSSYNKGETIWFKSYILSGDSLSDFSRNFFVDWYDQHGQLISHTIHPVFESSARGQFEIPANYPGDRIF